MEVIQFFKILVLLGFCGVHSDAIYDYYWRDYTGDIPKDAIEGGWDLNNKRTYIGHVNVKKFGIIPVTIYPGNTTVTANIQGIYHLNAYVMILCSATKNKFNWLSVNSANFDTKTINRHLVKGGVEYDNMITNIGRVTHQSGVIVGKVSIWKK